MIIRLKNADFSQSNIGTLSTWFITKQLGSGAKYNGPLFVEKDASLDVTITIIDGYEIGDAGVTVTMGGASITPIIDGNIITISIPSVTGNVAIKVPTVNVNTGEEDSGNTGGDNTGGEEITNIKLFQGFVSGHEINTENTTRVRTDAIYGPFTIKTNSGYVIRAIYSYPTAEVEDSTIQVEEVVAAASLTEYTYMGEDRYCYITFCKTNASSNILPTEDIIKELSKIELKDCVFTINPTPANATVKLNDVVQNSITVKSGASVSYEVSADGYVSKSGTYKVMNDYTLSIILSEMVESDSSIELYQGYSNETKMDTLPNRVRTDFIYGPFSIKLNEGYVIRAVYEYPAAEAKSGVAVVTSSQNLTEYEHTASGRYCIITFCKTDATADILPTENIIKEFLVLETHPIITQLDLKMGQYLSTSFKADNMARAVVGVPLNNYTSISTAGSDFIMIPLIDDDDNPTNGVYYTLATATDGSYMLTGSSNYVYKDTINISDVQAVNTDNKPIYVMFKKSNNANFTLEDLIDYITIN